jgi:hypothetical protein
MENASLRTKQHEVQSDSVLTKLRFLILFLHFGP